MQTTVRVNETGTMKVQFSLFSENVAFPNETQTENVMRHMPYEQGLTVRKLQACGDYIKQNIKTLV